MAPQGLVLAWLPRVDGVVLTEPPQYSILRGHVANVPMITGMFNVAIRDTRLISACQEIATTKGRCSPSPRRTLRMPGSSHVGAHPV